MRIVLFGKKLCAGCEETKEVIAKYLQTSREKIDFTFHDMETIEGMVEGANLHVSLLPTLIINSDDHAATHLVRWDGKVPDLQEIELALRGKEHALSH